MRKVATGRHNRQRPLAGRSRGADRRTSRTVPRTALGWAKRVRTRRVRLAVAAVVVVVLLAAGAALWAQSYLSTQPRALVDEAIEYVARADVNIIQMDDVLNSQVTTSTLGEISNVRPGVDVAIDALEEAQVLLDRAKRKDSSIVPEIRILEQAIDARLDMLALAPPLVSLTESAAESLVSAAAGYETLAAGAERAEAAKAGFNPRSDSSVERASIRSGAAIDLYRDARRSFELAAITLPEADFGEYLTYIDLNIQMSQALQGACGYLLKDEPTRANVKIRQFNELETKAAALGRALDPIEQIVEAGYESGAGTISADYSAARGKVLELDNLVR